MRFATSCAPDIGIPFFDHMLESFAKHPRIKPII
jgi:imidazoleglycerol phosphate dehydratase HisB